MKSKTKTVARKQVKQSKSKVPNGFRTIAGVLTIRAGDQVFHNGAWSEVTQSIGLTVSQAKTEFPKAVWARRVVTDDAAEVQPVAQIQNTANIPAGYVALQFGQIKQAGDLFLSEDNTWKPVTKSVGKRYRENSANRVVRRVLGNVVRQALTQTTAEVTPAPVVQRAVAVNHNRFTRGQRVRILPAMGDNRYVNTLGTIVHNRPSRFIPGMQTYILDLAGAAPEGVGNEAVSLRGEFLIEA